VVSFSMTLSDP